MILLVTQDLLFSSRIGHAAERRSLGFQVVGSVEAAGELLQGDAVEAVLVDLELNSVDLEELVAAIPDRSRTRVVAYGPHGQTARLEAARQAGCDLVLSRGQLDRDLDQLLDCKFASPQ